MARADILVAAVGRPELIRGTWIKPGAIVIDVGINRVAGEGQTRPAQPKTKLVGDVAFTEAIGRAGAITPVPGGVGPMTIAMLMENTLRAALMKAGLEPSLTVRRWDLGGWCAQFANVNFAETLTASYGAVWIVELAMDWRDWDALRTARSRELDLGLVCEALAARKWWLIGPPSPH